MRLIIKRILLLLTTIIIILLSFVYLYRLREEKTNKVPKSATLVFNNFRVDNYD